MRGVRAGAGLVACLVGLGAGCAGPSESAAHRAAELRWEVTEAAIEARDPVERRLTWPEAVEMLRAQGPAVLRSQDQVVRAEASLSRPYRELIPLIDARVGFIETLDGLGSLSGDDVLFDVFVTGILGGLVNLPERVFITRLAWLRARLLQEQAWREQVVVLHALFLQSLALEERRRVLELTLAGATRADAAGVDGGDAFGVRDIEDSLREIERSFDELDARVGSLLGEPTSTFVLVDAGLPTVDARSVLGPGLETALTESLALRIAAIDLVVADARVTTAWLDYLPQPELFITAPPVITRNNGEEIIADVNELRVTARLRLTIDARGSIAERVRFANLDRDTALREARLAVRTAVAEAMRLGDELAFVERDRAEAARRLELLGMALRADGVAGFQRRLTEATRARAAVARADLDAMTLVGPLLTLDTVWGRTFPFADARTPGRDPEAHDADFPPTDEPDQPDDSADAPGAAGDAGAARAVRGVSEWRPRGGGAAGGVRADSGGGN